jgi:hypothetical protein
MGVAGIIISSSYNNQEYIRVGYYVYVGYEEND